MRIHSIAFLALLGASACGGDDDSTDGTTVAPTPNANAVIPANGFAGRQLRVQISGDNTAWDSNTTVQFGDGITVGGITVASPTDIFAQVTIAADAKLGTRDVTVSDGTKLTGAFEIASPVTISFQGTVAQGSIGLFTIQNRDFDNPFDTTAVAIDIFGDLQYTNFEVDGPSGVAFTISSVGQYTASGTFLIDTDAAASGAVTTKSGPSGGTVVASPADTITVAARTAKVLTPGTAGTSVVAKAFDSDLYELDATAATTLNTIAATTTNADATPTVFLLPSSGHWADEITSAASITQVTQAATKFYAVTLDTAGVQGFQYAVNASQIALSNTVMDTEPNNTVVTAQTTTVPSLVTGTGGSAALTDDTDIDYFKITVPAGKKVHVITFPGDDTCDTVVDVVSATGTSFGGPSDDSNYHEDFISTAITTAGTYYVKIYASDAGFFDATQNHYQAAIFLE